MVRYFRSVGDFIRERACRARRAHVSGATATASVSSPNAMEVAARPAGWRQRISGLLMSLNDPQWGRRPGGSNQ
ncbi:MAG TPA: hypothetical protein VIQ62_08280, partial [Burkholderiales bacterium]